MLGKWGRTLVFALAVAVPLLMVIGITALADSNTPPASTGATALPGDPAKGAQLFSSNGCVACHGVNLEGGIGAKLNPIQMLPGVSTPLEPAYLEATIHNGRQPDGGLFTQAMPTFPKLSDQDLKDLAAFIIQQNQTVSPGLSPTDLARSDVFWVGTGILGMVLVAWLLATYNMRWIDRRTKARSGST